MNKQDYISVAKKIASSFFSNKTDLSEGVAKVAVQYGLDDSQVQNLCTAVNHVVYASLAESSNRKDDNYIEFPIARPEKVGEIVKEISMEPDVVYSDDGIFIKSKDEEKTASVAKHEDDLLKKDCLIRLGIQNVAKEHRKLADEANAAADRSESSYKKLYDLITNAILIGKSPSVIKTALSKVFDSNRFEIIWKNIEEQLISDGLIQRNAADSDRPDILSEYGTLQVNPLSGMIIVANDINRWLNTYSDKLREMDALEKEAYGLGQDLTKSLCIEKTAVIGAALKSIGTIGAKAVGKGVKLVGKAGLKGLETIGGQVAHPWKLLNKYFYGTTMREGANPLGGKVKLL